MYNRKSLVMKIIKLLVFVLCLSPLSDIYSQVRVGGGVFVDVTIDVPIPDVVVIGKRPKPRPKPRVVKKPRKSVIHTCNHGCNHNNNNYDHYDFGEIQNQNGPYGRQIYQVNQAHIEGLNNGLERVVYQLNSGDALELVIATANHNDYNYHSCHHNNCHQNNRIIEVLLNNQSLPLRDGSLSLQPKGQNRFHSVINLHSVNEGDFNGTVNF